MRMVYVVVVREYDDVISVKSFPNNKKGLEKARACAKEHVREYYGKRTEDLRSAASPLLQEINDVLEGFGMLELRDEDNALEERLYLTSD